jgi:hypothetical protein
MNMKAVEEQQAKQATRTEEPLLDKVLTRTEGIVNVSETGVLDYGNFAGLFRIANWIYQSGFFPRGIDTPEKIMVVIARGRSVGMDALQSLDCLYPVNGRVSVWGDMPLILARRNDLWVEAGFQEYWEVQGKRIVGEPRNFEDPSVTAVCETLRKGQLEPVIRRFSMLDAKRAGLTAKTGSLYGFYPQRMLPARARGFNIKDNFGDSLRGMAIREVYNELEDQPQPVDNSIETLKAKLREREKIAASPVTAIPESNPEATTIEAPKVEPPAQNKAVAPHKNGFVAESEEDFLRRSLFDRFKALAKVERKRFDDLLQKAEDLDQLRDLKAYCVSLGMLSDKKIIDNPGPPASEDF